MGSNWETHNNDPEVVGSDYINANFISSEVPGSENRYIDAYLAWLMTFGG